LIQLLIEITNSLRNFYCQNILFDIIFDQLWFESQFNRFLIKYLFQSSFMFDFYWTSEIVKWKRTKNLFIKSLLNFYLYSSIIIAIEFNDFVNIQIIIISQWFEVFTEILKILIFRTRSNNIIGFVCLSRMVIVNIQEHHINFECHLFKFLVLLIAISRISIY